MDAVEPFVEPLSSISNMLLVSVPPHQPYCTGSPLSHEAHTRPGMRSMHTRRRTIGRRARKRRKVQMSGSTTRAMRPPPPTAVRLLLATRTTRFALKQMRKSVTHSISHHNTPLHTNHHLATVLSSHHGPTRTEAMSEQQYRPCSYSWNRPTLTENTISTHPPR
jgi:hypothetical protein